MTAASDLLALQQQLKLMQASTISKKIFVGFDGFVDKIKKAVKERHNTRTVYYENMREFADRIAAATGKSGQIEMDVKRVKLGGNAPILSNTLGKLGLKSSCVGSMGYPERHAVFNSMSPQTELISVLNPGLSDAVEFADGKIIFSELEVFEQYDWNYLKKTAGVEKIRNLISESSLLAFVDWANLRHSTNIWEGILKDVVKPAERKDLYFLFDLCDPAKKSADEIKEVLDLMGWFTTYGKVTLGLNENETLRIWAALNGVDYEDAGTNVKILPVAEAGDFIFKMMSIETLLVHPVDKCVVFQKRGKLELAGRFVTEAKVLTGGGDNLNAGYCLGLLGGLPMEQCMLLGMAASGSYIENGVSSDIPDLIRYLDVWIRELQDNPEVRPRGNWF